MRAIVLILGLIGVVGGASAGDLDSPLYNSDAAAGRFTFETRFGGDHFGFTQRSFQLQFGSERQFNAGHVPFRTEYRPDSQQLLVNGVDLSPMVFANADDDSVDGRKGGWWTGWGGWVPLAIVLTGITFVVVDGKDSGSFIGSGGS